MGKKIAFLRKGTFKDSAGNEHTFDDAKLDKIISQYNPSFHEAPEVIGHPKADAPAWGWVKGVERVGDVLFYEPGQRVPEFQAMIDQGMFKKRSASFYPDLTLRHVGWLGAQPPAIKGLPDPATFSEGKEITIEFSEPYKMSVIARVLQRLREFIIDKFDAETADRTISAWEVEDLARSEEPVSTAFTESTEKEDDMGKVEELEGQIKDLQKQTSEFSESSKTKDAELVRLRQELAGERAKTQRQEFAAFCDAEDMKDKITPAMRPAVLDFMEILSGSGEFEFAEGDGKVKAAPVERFKTFLKALPKAVEFSEVATKGKGQPGGKDREAYIADFMEKNEGASYKDAVLAVSKDHPELFEER